MLKLCTQVLQDLTTDVPRKPRFRFWSNCVLKFYRIWPQDVPRKSRLQVLVKLCTQVLQDLTTHVPRKPRCRFCSNCVLKFYRM